MGKLIIALGSGPVLSGFGLYALTFTNQKTLRGEVVLAFAIIAPFIAMNYDALSKIRFRTLGVDIEVVKRIEAKANEAIENIHQEAVEEMKSIRTRTIGLAEEQSSTQKAAFATFLAQETTPFGI